MSLLDELLTFVNKKETLKKEHPLSYLLWEPSLHCNLECIHCSNSCTLTKGLASTELSTEEIKHELLDTFIDSLILLGIRRVRYRQ
ncbi:MAG: Unknown protein [uncultured Sulfurovum sp.]|uniref:Uncharacterized protein n=1 Tax=uncultured Sulfurovum sp. TaxID=269237 RepID=A0A6S6SDT6_9BACT|nr:MAG: Unknown protein [uncultured Sulfurovum sp.]